MNQLKNNLGINAATNPIATFQEFRDAITKRQMTGAFRTGWQPAYPSAEDYLFHLYDSSAGNGNGSNDGDYSNAKFDALMTKAYAAKSTAAANKIYQKSQEILMNDLPAIPLYYSNASGVAAIGVKGFEIDWQNLPVYTNLTK